jgi:sensor histidine kinase YesM
MATRQINWRFVTKKILLHLLFWIVILIYFAWGFGLQNPKRAIINMSFFLPGFFIMTYSLLYLLVPQYLLHRKFLSFFIGLIVVIGICILYTTFAQAYINSSEKFRGMIITQGGKITPYLHIGGIALSIKLLTYWYQQKKRTIEVEQQKTAAELQLLKSQLHPHFLFNTLNNLYSYTLENSPKSPEIVMKLTELLQFMIYKSNAPKIPLKKEIKLLQNYISLEELRYGERLDMSVKISGNIEYYQISPLLLLPFLENAFKHGTSKQLSQCWISMNISLENSVMKFNLANSIEPDSEEEQTKKGGLGLQNVKRRLELLYKDKYSFEAQKLNNAFFVNIEITLEELEERYMEKENRSLLQNQS